MFIGTNNIGKRVAKTSLALSAFALVTIMAAASSAAPPLSAAAKSALDKGHWGGPYTSVWIPGPYERPYNVSPPLAEAAKAKVANGSWGGPYTSVWVPGPHDKPYNVNPQISATTREKMNRGYGSVENGNIGDDTGGQYR